MKPVGLAGTGLRHEQEGKSEKQGVRRLLVRISCAVAGRLAVHR